MRFVLIPAGSFIMGADKNCKKCANDATPQHKVKITKSFYMGIYEVTQSEWVKVMGNNPSKFKGRSLPVEKVS